MTYLKRSVLLPFGMLALLIPSGQAAGQEGHPFIRELPGFALLQGSSFEDFGSHRFRVDTSDGMVREEIRGPKWVLLYEDTDEGHVWSPLEIIENYRLAALEQNGRILNLEDQTLDFVVPLPEGGTAWGHVHAWRDDYELTIVNKAPLERQLTFSAEEMQDEIDLEGRVTLHGVNFDFDKATLQPGADAVLDEVVRLMRDNPDLQVEIEGHTDNIGSRDYNLDLSQRRAETVRGYLVRHGIAAERMTSRGYGFDRPVTSNETEEGRARNRRVELVRR
jgi:OOP family OmpA-OmpF porin